MVRKNASEEKTRIESNVDGDISDHDHDQQLSEQQFKLISESGSAIFQVSSRKIAILISFITAVIKHFLARKKWEKIKINLMVFCHVTKRFSFSLEKLIK